MNINVKMIFLTKDFVSKLKEIYATRNHSMQVSTNYPNWMLGNENWNKTYIIILEKYKKRLRALNNKCSGDIFILGLWWYMLVTSPKIKPWKQPKEASEKEMCKIFLLDLTSAVWLFTPEGSKWRPDCPICTGLILS